MYIWIQEFKELKRIKKIQKNTNIQINFEYFKWIQTNLKDFNRF